MASCRASWHALILLLLLLPVLVILPAQGTAFDPKDLRVAVSTSANSGNTFLQSYDAICRTITFGASLTF